jgi:hypothetical protein
MRLIAVALMLSGFTQLALAQTTATAEAPSPQTAAKPSGFDLNTPVGEIAANPAGAAVVNKDIPGLLSDPSFSDIKGMSLKMIASLSSGQITKEMLAQTEADLKALPPGQ